MEGCLIVTYRCNARCYMCHTWQHPSRKAEEFTAGLIEKIPANLKFINITGGEPFIRSDLEEIVGAALEKTRRLVISTNGYFTDRMIRLAERYGNRVGFRISIEGLPAANDEMRGIRDGFDHALRALVTLCDMGIRDIGFGITVSDRNAGDMIELWRLADAMGVEFATAVTHNSYYFHKDDNRFEDPERIAGEFERIAARLLATAKPKNWFRAWFNMGLANKVRGGARPLPCEVGTDVFFLDPFGNLMPCNGSDRPMVMGNLNEKAFDEIWHSPQADAVRAQVKKCDKQCWMIGSASPAMKKRIGVPVRWIVKNKIRQMRQKDGEFCPDSVACLPVPGKDSIRCSAR
ncbi:radical SAM protein [Desulfonema ishimotonii]|uniref:Radical SAM protein n=1 Tax=Desulfonema ishimotonii TaxID=45657 RepID=A0A401FVD7_9BACT|nr:radical SAM protein [Desulfonema ishimotonii]GBC60918.1 radical SAM protein [Desulfonema ishimotonii]